MTIFWIQILQEEHENLEFGDHLDSGVKKLLIKTPQ